MPLRQILLPMLVPALVLAILLAISTWPAVNLAPHDLPIGLVAAPESVMRIQPSLTAGGFDVRILDGERSAAEAIEDRDISGALVIDQTGTRLLTASAASPVVADLLQRIATPLASTGTSGITVVDQVPLSPGDARGTGLASSIQPLLIAGLAGGVLAWRLRASRRLTSVVLLTGTLISGLTAMLMLDGWLGVLDGPWLPTFAAVWFSVLAVGALTVGLSLVLGVIGMAITGLMVVLIGGPLSGATSSPDLLPGWASVIGSLLPPGATATLLRGVAYFDGAGSLAPILVLTGWLLVGGLLLWLPSRSASSVLTATAANGMGPDPIVVHDRTPAR